MQKGFFRRLFFYREGAQMLVFQRDWRWPILLSVQCQVWQSFKQTDQGKDVHAHDREDGVDDSLASFQPQNYVILSLAW